MDDTLLWADNMTAMFHNTCAYISHCAGASITFSVDKFVFAMMELEYVGFVISSDSFKLSGSFLASIRDFPESKDITGARSWFGLMNQVNFAYSNSHVVLPL
jgi:hypothetical protein